MVVVDGQGIPLGNHLDSASPAEVTLIEKTLSNVSVPRKGRGRPRKNPVRVVYDKAADSDPLRERLLKRKIELIAPYRENRKHRPFENLESLKEFYPQRYIVERTFSWFGNFRRLVVRYEHDILMYQAFFHVTCIFITLRWF